MPYITEDDFELAFGADELEELLANGGDFARTEAAAASTISGYLAARYALPLAAVPDIVKAWALDITRYRLWDEAAPEEVRRRYEAALAQLRDAQAGRFMLPPDAAGVKPAAQFESEGYAAERVFTAETLRDF